MSPNQPLSFFPGGTPIASRKHGGHPGLEISGQKNELGKKKATKEKEKRNMSSCWCPFHLAVPKTGHGWGKLSIPSRLAGHRAPGKHTCASQEGEGLKT